MVITYSKRNALAPHFLKSDAANVADLDAVP